MISTVEKNQIKSIIQSQAWGTMELIKKDLVHLIESETTLKDTIDQTVMKTAFNEGQVAGINRFIQELFNTQL